MLFTSLEFLFLFLPITVGVYFALPFRWGIKNYWLLGASILFYAWGEPSFVFIMLASILFNYFAALLVSSCRNRSPMATKFFLAATVVGNLAVIGLWKYANFVTFSLRAVFPALQGVIPQTSFILPIGISFFTFQALSYVIDVYRGTVRVQRNPFYLALYIALFPQLIAGPIVRYPTVCSQIEYRRVSLDGFTSGVFRFLLGFNKKMLLANTFAIVADECFASGTQSVAGSWLGAICYTFQIFFDFSGYSDMAIGLGRIFGFQFPENFNYPYISRSVTEFWRRWHMSLSSWFRDYLYFPLGGSRVDSKWRLCFNLMVVWFATGVWHGANWTFILWGTLYGVLIIAEKLTGLPKVIESDRRLAIPGWLVTMFFVVVGWVLFRSDDLGAAGRYFGAMFGICADGLVDERTTFCASQMLVVLCAGVFASLPLIPAIKQRFGVCATPYLSLIWHSLQIVLFGVSVSYLAMNAHNPFIYFNF